MKKEMQKYLIPVAAVVASIGLGFAGVSAAQSAPAEGPNASLAGHMRAMLGGKGHGMMGKRGMGVAGTVTAVSGNTVTITGKDGKTYTVDASGAAILKTSTITVGQIAVGDTVGVHGTVSGTSVTADHIMDGILPMHGPGNGRDEN